MRWAVVVFVWMLGSLALVQDSSDSEDAAAWDRIMMRLQKPQWYGTQYVADNADSAYKLYRIDEDAVTDEERIRFHVPILKDAKKRVEILNRGLQKKPDEQPHAPKPTVMPRRLDAHLIR
jgi:hypothetical protein